MKITSLLLLMTLGLGQYAQAQLVFSSYKNYYTGGTPWSLTSADFNNDGKKDIVTGVNFGNTSTSLILGNGNGTFANLSWPSNPSNAYGVINADFNNDGKKDIAVADNNSNVNIGLGDGVGGFAFNSYTVGLGPIFLIADDFNNDGKLDIVTANKNSVDISVILGTGTGTFGSAINIAQTDEPLQIASADFNNDGKKDLAVIKYLVNKVFIYQGNGSGNFTAGSSFTVGTQPRGITAGDYNGDGKMDVATGNGSSNNMSVLLGTGTGSFGTAVNYPAAAGPNSIITSDFNNDGKKDIALAAAFDAVSIYLGAGNGTFSAPTNLTLHGGSSPECIIAEDFNGDNKLDIATANTGSDSISIFLNQTPNSITHVQNELQECTIYPNPTSKISSLQFTMKTSKPIYIEVTDLIGKKIFGLREKGYEGVHQVELLLSNVNSGIYSVNLYAENSLMKNLKLIKE